MTLSACPIVPETSTLCTPAQNFTLVFYDRSASATGNDKVGRLFSRSLNEISEEALACEGDRISAFLLHGRTRGKANRVDVTSEAKTEELGHLSNSRQSVLRKRYERKVQQERETAAAAMDSLFARGVVERAYTRHTDLLGSLEVASEEISRAPDSARVRIYYMSDMYESMRGDGRRDFDATPPMSREEAEAWAAEDAELVLRTMNVDTTHFGNAEVRVLLGELANKPNTQEVKFYWLELLDRLGFNPTNVHYN